MTDSGLIAAAKEVQGEFRLSQNLTAGAVGAALCTGSGKIYTGICMDLACGIGTCAEHGAIAEMLKSRETRIDMIVAVCGDTILPPCGRCRELMAQIDEANFETRVVLGEKEIVPLRDLLPYHWLKLYKESKPR